jgi:hypothetical protein
MRADTPQSDGSVALASGSVAGAGAGGQSDSTIALPRISFGDRFTLPRTRIALHPLAGRYALLTLMLGALIVVVFATAGPSVLVPRSNETFPNWEAGPLGGLFGHITRDPFGLDLGFSLVVVAMLIAYLIALAAVRTLSMRWIVGTVIALHVILVMSPPEQLTDVFNYIGYARLGGLHHLNPYTHVIANELRDPVYRFATWYHLPSPYGPLFTVVSYPLGLMSLAGAYWVLKIAVVLASLTFIALVAKCAKLLGRDPRYAVLFVAANPVYLMYAITGFHNDFFMLIPSTAAIALLLARHDRLSGAALMLAVAVKFTAVLLAPFLLIAATPMIRRRKVIEGAVIAAIPLALMWYVVFGFAIPNLADQSTLLTPWSAPNVLGMILGVGGGTASLLRLANIALVVTIALLVRRNREWLDSAGWTTFALIASLAWLVPWYVIWLLPLAALGNTLKLRRAAIAMTVYLVFAFVPTMGWVQSKLGFHMMSGSAGQASTALQKKLEQ